MENLISEMNERIEFEKLLFSNKNYTPEEEKKIIKRTAKSLSDNAYFIALSLQYMPKIINLMKKYKNEEEYREDLKLIYTFIENWNLSDEDDKVNDIYMARYLYGGFIGFSDPNSYFRFIYEDIMDADVVRDILDGKYDINHFYHNTNFLLTNNFFLFQYPDFYDNSDIEKLRVIAKERNKNSFTKKEDYYSFKKAGNSTLNLIRRKMRNNKAKNKTLKKTY